jgi:hypothetical protein
MPRIASAFDATKAASALKLKPNMKAVVDSFSLQLLAALPKAHEPRSFELTVKTMIQQLQQQSAYLQKMELGFSPIKAYRRRKEVQTIEASIKFIQSCTVGEFETHYQNTKKEFLGFLEKAYIEKIMQSESSFLREIQELLKTDDLSVISLLEEHLENGKFKDEYHQQFNQLLVLMKLKAAYNPNPVVTPHLPQDLSLLHLEGEIEQRRMQASIEGQTELARALKYLAIGCNVSTAKTTSLQEAITKHGKNMQAYKHNDKCRELGGRVVLHCNQAMLPGIGLDSGICYGLSHLWAEQLIKKDSFLGFRGNQEAYIQPTQATAKILQAIPSFNEFIRIDSKIIEKQQSQNGDAEHEHEVNIGSDPKKQFQEFSERVLQEANKNSNSAIFCGYFTESGAHTIALRKRKTPTPQGYLIDYFDANSGWMQFKDDKSFKEFFNYYLNDRNDKSKFKRICYDITTYPCSYNHALGQLSEEAPHPPNDKEQLACLLSWKALNKRHPQKARLMK